MDVREAAPSKPTVPADPAMAAKRIAWPALQPPLQLPPPTAFPLDALPRAMAEYVAAAADALPCPPDLVAVAALASAATAIGNSHCLEVKAGWVEGPRLWCAIICDPGAKKSPALAAATRPLREAQRDCQRAFLAAEKNYEAHPAGPPPVMQQLFTSDTTREGLTSLLSNSRRGIALLADELSGWVHRLYQSRRGRSDDRQFWLSLWSGAEILVNRARARRQPTAYITQPMLSVLGCLPPAALGHLQDDAAGADGFIHRVLFSWPERVPSGWSEAEPAAAVRAAYDELFRRLLAQEVPLQPGTGEVAPRLLRWSPAGKETWVEYVRRLAADLNQAVLPEFLRGHWAKLEGYGARLALVVHVCRLVMGETASADVDECSMMHAARLVEYFQAHARRVHAWFHSQTAGTDRNVQAVLNWLRRHRHDRAESQTFSWRRLRHDLHNRFAHQDDELRRVLRTLEEEGYIRRISTPRPQRGRPPEPTYLANPAI